jgi:hypothetical protein
MQRPTGYLKAFPATLVSRFMHSFRARSGGPLVFPSPDYDKLYGLFPDADGIPSASVIPGGDVPEPHHKLLVHTHHMTVTVEQFYSQPVNVAVLESRLDGSDYARKILLTLRDTGTVVQFGIVQLDLDLLAPKVRDEITAQQTPLGRVLIRNNVFRRVQPTAYLRVTPNAAMCDWFGLTEPKETYGRLGVIFCDGKPAIVVLEVLAPVAEKK